jgi:hypothetical protein
MIQRIQSIYLFLAATAIFLIAAFPISSYYGDMHTFNLTILKIENFVPDATSIFNPMFTFPLAFFVGIIGFITTFTIFKYKNRKLQLKLVKISVLLNIFLIIGVFFVYSKIISNSIDVVEEYKTSAFLPLVSLVLLVLAYKGIKKDEDLVRSTDRLR